MLKTRYEGGKNIQRKFFTKNLKIFDKMIDKQILFW